MKHQPKAAHGRTTHRGFTLLELLVVMVIIAILASLTLGAFRYAQESSSRNRTVSAHGAIRAALEQYKEKFGEYPEPAAPEESMTIGGTPYRVGGAHMLYQAITGDGSNAIKLQAGSSVAESDGEVDDTERENTVNFSGLPKSVIYPNLTVGMMQPRILVDGWSRPFQYAKAEKDASVNTAVNPTYDLWSYGPKGDKAGELTETVDSKREAERTASWIKNW